MNRKQRIQECERRVLEAAWEWGRAPHAEGEGRSADALADALIALEDAHLAFIVSAHDRGETIDCHLVRGRFTASFDGVTWEGSQDCFLSLCQRRG